MSTNSGEFREKSWIEAELQDSFDEELEMEIDDERISEQLRKLKDRKRGPTLDRRVYRVIRRPDGSVLRDDISVLDQPQGWERMRELQTSHRTFWGALLWSQAQGQRKGRRAREGAGSPAVPASEGGRRVSGGAGGQRRVAVGKGVPRRFPAGRTASTLRRWCCRPTA